MTSETWQRLFDPREAFDHPVTRAIVVGVVAALLLAPPAMLAIHRRKPCDEAKRRDLWARYRSWWVLAPLMTAPVLLGAASTILAVAALSMLCYREFARGTGLFRERTISAIVGLGILAVTFATVDHWYNFFMALVPLTVITIAAAGILSDRPRGYIQRVALGTLGFLLFGSCLGHLGYIANDPDYRPLLLTVLLCVEANDIFAFTAGRLLGRRQLAPNTSPNKTVTGALSAVALTTLLFALIGRVLFARTVLVHPGHVVALGALISVAGQLGDLMLSSIKRDLGIKDFGATIPGHGGLLDRFDSLILVAPAFFHYVGYFLGFGWDERTRIFSG